MKYSKGSSNVITTGLGLIKNWDHEKPLEKMLEYTKESKIPVFCSVLKKLSFSRAKEIIQGEKKKDEKKDMRQFLAGNWIVIQKYYTSIIDQMIWNVNSPDAEEMTLMEIIKESEPCRFYIDAESELNSENTMQDWEITNRNVINFIMFSLVEYFELPRNYKVDYICLDSSSERKFSKHLIFYVRNEDNGQEMIFPNNVCFKEFINHSLRSFHENIAKQLDQGINQEEHGNAPHNENESDKMVDDDVVEDIQLEPLKVIEDNNQNFILEKTDIFLQDRHGGRYQFEDQGYGRMFLLKNGRSDVDIIDKTVYTKNRNFRIALSTKLGQKRPLIPEFCSIAKINELIEKKRHNIPVAKPFFKDWDIFTQKHILDTFNEKFLFETTPICLFEGWKNCGILEIPKGKLHSVGGGVRKTDKNEKGTIKTLKSNASSSKNLFPGIEKKYTSYSDRDENFSSLFAEIREELQKLDNKGNSKIHHFFKSDNMKINYNRNNVFFFGAQNKMCLIKGSEHIHNNVNTIISVRSLDVIQRCLDGDCEKKERNKFVCNLRELIPMDLQNRLSLEISKIFLTSKRLLNDNEQDIYERLYDKLLNDFI